MRGHAQTPPPDAPISPPAPSVTAPGRLPKRPRRTILLRMLVALLLVAIVPAVVCVTFFQTIVRQAIVDKGRRDGDMLANVIALSLSGRIEGYSTQRGELLDVLGTDPRVAFACVTNRDMHPLHFGVFDAPAFERFRSSPCYDALNRRIDPSTPTVVGLMDDIVVRSAPIRSGDPNLGRRTSPNRASEPPEGYLVLGIRDAAIQSTMRQYQIAQLCAVGITLLIAVPLVAAGIRNWTKPLRQLIEATRQFGSGHQPMPVKVSTKDELGYLAEVFNEAAQSHWMARRELSNVNQKLEHDVEQRTRQLREANQQLKELSETDALTGLANRRAFWEAFGNLSSEDGPERGRLCVVLIDLDGFKQVNDTKGHESGDAVLQVVADGLRSRCRDKDVKARLGGDEFVVLMPGADLESGRAMAERVRLGFLEDIAARFPAWPRGTVSMSMGMSCRDPNSSLSAEELLEQADDSMYEAKRRGKSTLVVHGEQRDGPMGMAA